jgi:ectoine hydroxylase-related dioxygenase (phytanoyl-CoA dioxygenase family)
LNQISHAAHHVKEVEELGYTIIPELLTGERLMQARAKCDDWLVEFAARGIDGGKVRGRYRKGLLSVTRLFDDLYTHPLLLEIAAEVFGPGEFLLAGAMIKNVVPGEDARDMHRDDGIYGESNGPSPSMLNTLLALDDFTRETGATHVVPGSHRWTRPVEQDHQYIMAEMKAGSLLMIHGTLWHQNGRNLTADQERRALGFAYRRRDLQDRPPAAPELVIADLPAALRSIVQG